MLIAFFVRFISIVSIPPHASLDEVSIGYNALSILQTGRDEYGTFFPILLRAYDDWRPALYVYLVIPFIYIFGLDIISVRIPSVILSVFTIVSIFFLTKYFLLSSFITSTSNVKKDYEKRIDYLSLSTSMLLTLSPWHIYLSRLGHEVNAAFSFLIFGLTFFFMYIFKVQNKNTTKKTVFYLLLSSLFLSLSFNSYQSTKIVIPALMLTLSLLFHKQLFQNKKAVIFSAILGLVVSIPILVETVKPEGLIRFQATNLFSSQQELLQKNAEVLLKDKQEGNLIGQVLHNRRVVYTQLFTTAFISHLDPFWIFANRNDESFKVPNIGLLYLFELPLLIVGIIFFILSKEISIKHKLFLGLWIPIAILPGALTTDYPHAMRVFNILPVLYIFISFGIISIIYFLKSLCGAAVIGLVSIYSFGFIIFLSSYFLQFSTNLSHHFQYGVLSALSYAQKHEREYESIVVSNKGTLFQSYMFYLFNSELDPLMYQKMGGTHSGGFEEEHRIGKYFFSAPPFKANTSNTLYILDANDDIPKNTEIINRIKFLDGKDAIIYTKKMM